MAKETPKQLLSGLSLEEQQDEEFPLTLRERLSDFSRDHPTLVITLVTLLVLLSTGTVFYLQLPRTKVARTCGGLLDVDTTLDLAPPDNNLLGYGSRYHVTEDVEDVPAFQNVGSAPELPILPQQCNIENLFVNIASASELSYAYAGHGMFKVDRLPQPMGGGWPGFVSVDDGWNIASASVALPCTNWDARKGKGVFVTLTAVGGDRTQPSLRKLARATAHTAQRAAKRTGCHTTTGDPDNILAAETKPRFATSQNATGTCHGITTATHVEETAATVSPVEDCYLIDTLHMRASYGPFAATDAKIRTYGNDKGKPTGATSDNLFTTARCENGLDSAFYFIQTVDKERNFKNDPLTPRERADFMRFAKQSAARHGCEEPHPLPAHPTYRY